MLAIPGVLGLGPQNEAEAPLSAKGRVPPNVSPPASPSQRGHFLRARVVLHMDRSHILRKRPKLIACGGWILKQWYLYPDVDINTST